MASGSVMEVVLNTMPAFAAEKTNNSLMSLLNGDKEKEKDAKAVGAAVSARKVGI